MEQATNGTLTQAMWRKNHQWLGLTRKHVLLTVNDTIIASVHPPPSPLFCRNFRTSWVYRVHHRV